MTVTEHAYAHPLKHIAIRDYVRGLVEGGAPGMPAPSERELVERFRVSRMTVRRAMENLVVEGLLERIPGRGTFLARPKRVASQVCGFEEEMIRRGVRPAATTLLLRAEVSTESVARALAVPTGEVVLHWRRLRSVNDEPVCIEDAYVPERVLPALLSQMSTGRLPVSLYRALELRGLRPSWSEDYWHADLCTEVEAQHLACAPQSAVMRKKRRSIAADKVVEISRSVYRADRYHVLVQLSDE